MQTGDSAHLGGSPASGDLRAPRGLPVRAGVTGLVREGSRAAAAPVFGSLPLGTDSDHVDGSRGVTAVRRQQRGARVTDDCFSQTDADLCLGSCSPSVGDGPTCRRSIRRTLKIRSPGPRLALAAGGTLGCFAVERAAYHQDQPWPRIFAFSAANSASVRAPLAWRFASVCRLLTSSAVPEPDALSAAP